MFFFNKPPKTTLDNLLEVIHLEKLLYWFLKKDAFFKTLKSDKVRNLFQQGYGIDVKSDTYTLFQKGPIESRNIFKYLVTMLWSDIVDIVESMQSSEHKDRPAKEFFAEKIKFIGEEADQTIQIIFTISEKYSINPADFKEEELSQLNTSDNQKFKDAFVKDALLSSEMRILAWIYKDLFGETFEFTKGQ